MQDTSLLGDSSSSKSKRLILRAQKLQLVASSKHNAVPYRDYVEILEECFKPEAAIALRMAVYKLICSLPSCSNTTSWTMVRDGIVEDLASPQSVDILEYILHTLEAIPISFVLEFLMDVEKDPMNRIRSLLLHEDFTFRRVSIATFARISIKMLTFLESNNLLEFPFESDQVRSVCRQDVHLAILDIWKIIYQALQDTHISVAVQAYTSLSDIFALSSVVQESFKNVLRGPACWSIQSFAVNDIVLFLLKQACPAICTLFEAVQKLDCDNSIDAIRWMSMLLSLLCDRTGATCAGISVPCLEVDVNDSMYDEMEAEDGAKESTRRIRIDQVAHDFISSIIQPILCPVASLAQMGILCRATFQVLLHPLQEFCRVRFAYQLLEPLMVQCYYQEKAEDKKDMALMLCEVFIWISHEDCVGNYIKAAKAMVAVDRERLAISALDHLTAKLVFRCIKNRDLKLLQALCDSEFYKMFDVKTIVSTNSQEQLVAAESLKSLLCNLTPLPNTLIPIGEHRNKDFFQAQLLLIRTFSHLIRSQSLTAHRTDLFHEIHECFMALITSHYEYSIKHPECALSESLCVLQNLCTLDERSVCRKTRFQLFALLLPLRERIPSTGIERAFGLFIREIEIYLAEMEDMDQFAFGTDSEGFASDCTAQLQTSAAIVSCMRRSSDSNPNIAIFKPLYLRMTSLFAQVKQATYIIENDPAFQLHPPSTIHESSHLQDWYACPASREHSKSLYSSYTFDLLDFKQPPVTVTGCCDPLAISISYRHPEPLQMDCIALIVDICNVTNVDLDNFDIQMHYSANLKSEYPINDTRLCCRPQNNCTTLKSGECLQMTRPFRFLQFGLAVFAFRVRFCENEEEIVQLAVTNAYRVSFAAQFRIRSDVKLPSASEFRKLWDGMESNVILNVVSPQAKSEAKCSFARRILHDRHICVHDVQDLLMDTDHVIHIAYVAQTFWHTFILISLTLVRKQHAAAWNGTFEIRSGTNEMEEMGKAASECLKIFCSDHLWIQKLDGDFVKDKIVSEKNSAFVGKTVLDETKLDERDSIRLATRPVDIFAQA